MSEQDDTCPCCHRLYDRCERCKQVGRDVTARNIAVVGDPECEYAVAYYCTSCVPLPAPATVAA